MGCDAGREGSEDAPGTAAQEYLQALSHLEGRAARRDDPAAARWLLDAAREGYAPAQLELARTYDEGLAVEEDPFEATRWFRAAAEQDEMEAAYQLGLRLARGRGAEPDPEEARRWLERAAELGHGAAALELGGQHNRGDGAERDPVRAAFWFGIAVELGLTDAARPRDIVERKLEPAGVAEARRRARLWSQEHFWSIEVLDANGEPTPARVSLTTREGRAVYPPGLPATRDPYGIPFFYTAGRFRIAEPDGELHVRVEKGFEHVPWVGTLDGAGPVRLERAFDVNRAGYYGGDGHVHPNFTLPRDRLTNHELLLRMEAEDLDFANLLAGNTFDSHVYLAKRVTGRREPESTPHRILRVSEEYRSSVFGHMSVYGVRRLSDPVFTALPDSPYPHDFPTNYEAARSYAEQGAFPTFAHLIAPFVPRPAGAELHASECPTDVALGVLRGLEVQGYAVITGLALAIWERFMSAGFDLVITAGTDAFLARRTSDVLGSARSYVDLGDQPFDDESFQSQLARGRGFTTNGPLVFLEVDGRGPGDTIALEPGEIRRVSVEIRVDSVFPWETLTVRANGRDALVFASAADDARRQTFRGDLELDGPGWIYARVLGPPLPARPATGARRPPRREAITNAAWVTRGDEQRRDARSIQYFLRWIDDNLETLERRDNYGSAANRTQVRNTFLRAREVYERRLAEARKPGAR